MSVWLLSFCSWFSESLSQLSVEQVAITMKNVRLVVVFISNNFVQDEHCVRLFHFAKAPAQTLLIPRVKNTVEATSNIRVVFRTRSGRRYSCVWSGTDASVWNRKPSGSKCPNK